MAEQISHLARELSKEHNFNKLKKHVKKILVSDGIVSRQFRFKKKHFIHYGKNTDICTFGCILGPEESNLKKKIEIGVRADHSACRQLRVIVQIGDRVIIEKAENRDKKKWNDRKVFDKEIKAAEEEIRTVFKKAA